MPDDAKIRLKDLSGFIWCTCAKYDKDTGRYDCSVSGDECMFMMPNAVACAKKYGEGPLADLCKESSLL